MATYPSGLTRTFPEPDDFPTAAAWGVQLELALEEQPLGPSAACMNPECANPVDYAPCGTTLIYCSSYCRNRASDIRRRITQQTPRHRRRPGTRPRTSTRTPPRRPPSTRPPPPLVASRLGVGRAVRHHRARAHDARRRVVRSA